MHGILRTRRMFQARIPSEENQEAGSPILRATMARRHQFRDYSDSIPREIWPFLCGRFNGATRRKFREIIVENERSEISAAATTSSLFSSFYLPLSIKTGRFNIHVAFSHSRCRECLVKEDGFMHAEWSMPTPIIRYVWFKDAMLLHVNYEYLNISALGNSIEYSATLNVQGVIKRVRLRKLEAA